MRDREASQAATTRPPENMWNHQSHVSADLTTYLHGANLREHHDKRTWETAVLSMFSGSFFTLPLSLSLLHSPFLWWIELSVFPLL